MQLPTEDKYLKQMIGNTIFAVKQGACSTDSGTKHILKYLEERGYHIGLPSNIEEALNSGDGVYRP